MRRRLVWAMAATAFGLAGAGAAEKPPPLIPSWKQSHLEQGNIAVRSLYRLAVCARMQRLEAVEALLATAPGSAEESARLKAAWATGEKNCRILTRKLTVRSRPLIRGALAEALYNGAGTKLRSASALPLNEIFQPPPYRSRFAVPRWVARCAVRRQPRLAHEVVRHNPGAVGEERALRTLKPTFIACLPARERLQVSRLNIRALIAEELYLASVTFKEAFAHAKN